MRLTGRLRAPSQEEVICPDRFEHEEIVECHRAKWSWLRWSATPTVGSHPSLPLVMAPATLLGLTAYQPADCRGRHRVG